MCVRYPQPTLWWAFACDVHVEWLHAPRRLLDRDRAELDRHRDQKALALAGRPYARTEPLATPRWSSSSTPLLTVVRASPAT